MEYILGNISFLYILAACCISMSIILAILSDTKSTLVFFLEAGLFIAGIIILMHVLYMTGALKNTYTIIMSVINRL